MYDLGADEASQIAVNIEGTRHTVEFAKAIDAGHFHHVSSIAAAGLYEGVFREDMFEEAENYEHPYFLTKHESEKIVRKECKVPWTVFRPAMVVGDSSTGEMDKVDGPYYFFKLIQRMRQLLPPWMPAVGLEGGRVNIVPVDFVVNALDHISHKTAIAKKCFHLVDPTGYRVGDVLDIFSKAAHAPKMNVFVNAALLGFIPKAVKKSLMALAPVRRIRNAILKDLGLPEDMLTFVNYPTRFDCRDTLAALKGSGIDCPNLHDYAWRLWDYWERHLDPDLHIDRSLARHRGRQGGAGHRRLVGHWPGGSAQVCRGGRHHHHLRARPGQARRSLQGSQGQGLRVRGLRGRHCRHGRLRPLHPAAGRQPRRGGLPHQQRRPLDPPRHRIELRPLPRFRAHHAAQLLWLPARHHGAAARHGGQKARPCGQHQLDWRADQRAALFGLCGVSKAALDAWTRCASSEFADVGISFTTINMPLVRTPMIAPTNLYNNVPTLSPEEAADMVAQACIFKPVRIATRLGIAGQVLHALVPRVAQIAMNTSFRMFPDSSAAKGDKAAKPQLSAEAIAMQQMMRGIHF